MSKESIKKLILQYATMIESRKFANAMRIYQEVKKNLEKGKWSDGYLKALRGIFLVKKIGDNYAFFGNKDLDLNNLKRELRRFRKSVKDPLLSDFDKGYFAAVTDYTRALIKLKR